VERSGRPLALSTHAANHHEVKRVQLSLDFYMLDKKPDFLIGEGAYFRVDEKQTSIIESMGI